MAIPVSESVYFAIQQAAWPITPSERPQFLIELAAELQRYPVVDVGLAHRVCAELQKRFTVEARSAAIGDAQKASARFRRGSSAA
jgi:hypothetical protein